MRFSAHHVLRGRLKPHGSSVMEGMSLFSSACVHSWAHLSVILNSVSLAFSAVLVGGLLEVSLFLLASSMWLCIGSSVVKYPIVFIS